MKTVRTILIVCSLAGLAITAVAGSISRGGSSFSSAGRSMAASPARSVGMSKPATAPSNARPTTGLE